MCAQECAPPQHRFMLGAVTAPLRGRSYCFFQHRAARDEREPGFQRSKVRTARESRSNLAHDHTKSLGVVLVLLVEQSKLAPLCHRATELQVFEFQEAAFCSNFKKLALPAVRDPFVPAPGSH